jgi:hypothetical protein
VEWLQHNADVAVIECQPSDVGIWQQRLEARAKQEVGGITSHKPTTWAELTDLICRYMSTETQQHNSAMHVASQQWQH